MKENFLIILSLMVLTSICDTASQLFLKSSVNSIEVKTNGITKIISFIIRLIRTPRVWTSFTFSTASLILWLYILSKVDLSLAFSVCSMHYIFIAIASGWILKEKIGLNRWAGTVLIVIGIILVTLS